MGMENPTYVVRTTYVSEVSDPMFNNKKACEQLAEYFARQMPEHPDWEKKTQCVEVGK